MRNPLVSSTDRVHPLWSGAADYNLRPIMMVAREGSGFRPVDISDFGTSASISGTVSITGIVAVDGVGITGANGLSVNVISASGFNAFPVIIASGSFPTAPSTQGIKPALPSNYFTYGINLTGTGSFSNYSSLIPNINGNPVNMSVEPDSDNVDKVWYAFSGTSSTGQAFELRGDKTFEVSGTTSLFLAQASSGNRVMIHCQIY